MKLVAVCLAGLSVVGLAISIWMGSVFDTDLWKTLSAICALVAVLAAAATILPSPYQERAQRGDDVWDLSAIGMVTNRWWCVITLAIVVAAGAYFAPLSVRRLTGGSGDLPFGLSHQRQLEH